jgi:hypothetical protein
MTKLAGSGSISQKHGSEDPDPPQNVMDPEHCQLEIIKKVKTKIIVVQKVTGEENLFKNLPHRFNMWTCVHA